MFPILNIYDHNASTSQELATTLFCAASPSPSHLCFHFQLSLLHWKPLNGVNTQMKCTIMLHFIRVYTLCKDKNNLQCRNTSYFRKLTHDPLKCAMGSPIYILYDYVWEKMLFNLNTLPGHNDLAGTNHVMRPVIRLCIATGILVQSEKENKH